MRLTEVTAWNDEIGGRLRATRRNIDGSAARLARRRCAAAQLAQARREVDEPLGNDMDDEALALQPAGAAEQRGAEHDAAIRLEDSGPDDEVGDAGLVLDRDED